MPWVTPSDAATETLAIVLRIPNHAEARAQLRGLLLECTDAENYTNEYGISELDAAAEWEDALIDALEVTTCDDI